MCGIVGAWHPLGNADDTWVQAALPVLSHRGPDGKGLWIQRHVALGHARLAIHDLTGAGTQPFCSDDQRLVTIVNGTIHNADELRAELAACGVTLRSRSDSELVIPLYQRHGREFVARLRGPFALALFDARRDALFLARDRLGQRPLFYCRFGGELRFASEMRALLWRSGSFTWLPRQAAAFLQAGYVPEHGTLIEGAQSVKPGTWLWAEGEDLQEHTWWRPSAPPEAGAEERPTRDLMDVLSHAVEIRTRTERPLGVLLSGGLDSASILHVAQQRRSEPIPSFTLGFHSRRHDERDAARTTAQALGSPHRDWAFDIPPETWLQELLATSGEALADASFLALAWLCRKARDHATVLLVGDGGDEMLLGYRRYRLAALASHPRVAWRRVLAALGSLAPNFRVARGLAALGEGPAAVLADLVGLLPRRDLGALLRPEVFPAEDPLTSWYRKLEAPLGNGANAAALWDLQTYLPGDLLAKTDRAAMASGVEIWAPFLDPEVVDTCLALPASLKWRRYRGKAPLKRLLSPNVPARILARRKQGFGVPLDNWLRHGSYGAFARSVLGDHANLFRELFREGSALPTWQRHQEGERELAPLVHACVVLALTLDVLRQASAA